MTDIVAEKRLARRQAAERRAATAAPELAARAQAHLLEVLRPRAGQVISGYQPIRTELDPLPVLTAMQRLGPVCMPVVQGPGRPLRFRAWRPGCALVEGPFGALVPAQGDWMIPDVLVMPLLAFDADAVRLGYGGGYYDRTLAALRAQAPALAVGFAYAGQEVPVLPREATDVPLDLIVTEAGVRHRADPDRGV